MIDRLRFRAFYNGKMYDVICLNCHTQEYIILKGDGYCFNADWDKCQIMQCIGQSDKNNKLIYEGDIVSCYGGEYYNGYWEFDKDVVVKGISNLDDFIVHCEYLEIIGNIYENKELI